MEVEIGGERFTLPNRAFSPSPEAIGNLPEIVREEPPPQRHGGFFNADPIRFTVDPTDIQLTPPMGGGVGVATTPTADLQLGLHDHPEVRLQLDNDGSGIHYNKETKTLTFITDGVERVSIKNDGVYCNGSRLFGFGDVAPVNEVAGVNQ